MSVKLWAILVYIYIYFLSVACLACFCLFVSSSYLRQGIHTHCNEYVIIISVFGGHFLAEEGGECLIFPLVT